MAFIPSILEERLGLGMDLVVYYNLWSKWKIGINYNPNIYEFIQKELKYFHNLLLEVRFNL